MQKLSKNPLPSCSEKLHMIILMLIAHFLKETTFSLFLKNIPPKYDNWFLLATYGI
jgi:hypothetical protein